MMKVLVINPWIGNMAEYSRGLCEGLSSFCEVTLVTNYYDIKNASNYTVIRSFFEKSEKIERGITRKALRGYEYCKTFKMILDLVKENRFDIVHVQWFLMYPLDLRFIKELKKYAKVALTAHNVLPHVKGERYIKELNTIYDRVDMIFVHGESIRDEFVRYFPKYQDKIRIQNHGDLMSRNTSFDLSLIPEEIQRKVDSSNIKYIFFGNIFYNKGTDILLKTWIDHYAETNDLLIISGRSTERFVAFDELCTRAKGIDNVLVFNTYVEDNFLNYLISNSNIVVLPYRHASMSGVVFTAAAFKKPIICTEAGSITEYVGNGENCFVCSPNEESLRAVMEEIRQNYTAASLKELGNSLYKHIEANYSWYEISKKLVLNYQELLDT